MPLPVEADIVARSELKINELFHELEDFCVGVGELGGESKLINSIVPAAVAAPPAAIDSLLL